MIKYINTSYLRLCDKVGWRSDDFDSSKTQHFNNYMILKWIEWNLDRIK